MKIKLYKSRRVTIETLPFNFVGTQYEQNATILEFNFANLELNDLEKITKTIHFFKDEVTEENYIGDAIIRDDKYSLTTNVTKCEIVKAFVQIMKDTDLIWKSEIFELKFKASLNVDKTLDEEQKSILQDLINKVESGSGSGSTGVNGATFTPSISEIGDLSWTNDRGLENPKTVNIKGPKGDLGERGPEGPKGDSFKYEDFTEEQLESLRGPKGEDGETGPQGIPGEPGADGYTPVKGTDYFTEEDKNELVQQVISNFVNAEEVSY